MKAIVVLLIALVFLAGSAHLLLRTQQAPPPALPRVPVAAPAPTVPEKKIPTTEEFRALGAELVASLPLLSQFKKGQDLPILVAGEKFAELNRKTEGDPGLQAELMSVYQGCALSGQYQDGVRALCFWHLRALARQTGKTIPNRAVPPHIRELTDRL
jgi:hypothetical protein